MKNMLKRTLAILLALVMVFSFAACGSEETATEETKETTDASVGVQDRTLTVCMQNAINNFRPDGGSMMGQGQVMRQIFETLFERDENEELVPWLAESYEWKSATEIVVKIREGIKFNNGEDLTAEDVIYTYKTMYDDHTTGYDQVSCINFEKTTMPDAYTIDFVLNNPEPDFCECLQHPFTGIRCKSASTDWTVIDSCVGTGPYMMESFNPGATYTLVINENYWNTEAAPHIKHIEFTVISDNATRTNEALAGTTNVMYDMNSNDADLFRDNADVHYFEGTTGGVEYLTINTASDTPLSNAKVREAVFYALDRDAITKVGHGTYGKTLDTLFAPIDGAADTSAYSGTYDLEKAKALLKEAGYENGFDCTITVTSSNQGRMDEAEAISSMLKEVGINSELDIVAGNVCQEKIMQGQTDMAIYGVTATTFEVTMLFKKFLPDSSYFKMYSLDDQTLFDLINEGMNLTDATARNAKYEEAQMRIAQAYCAYPLWNMTYSAVLSANTEGFRLNRTFQQHLLQYVYFTD